MAISNPSPTGEVLQVDGFGLSIGSVSVGLPTACTADVVLLRYLDLIRLVHRDTALSSYVAPCHDIQALAAATKLDPDTVRSRLERLSR